MIPLALICLLRSILFPCAAFPPRARPKRTGRGYARSGTRAPDGAGKNNEKDSLISCPSSFDGALPVSCRVLRFVLLVGLAGLEPARYRYQRIFLLHYVAITA